MKGTHLVDYRLIRHMVGNIHVMTPYHRVCREIMRKMHDGIRTWRTMTPCQRRALVRAICYFHWRNREMFYFVMSGSSAKWTVKTGDTP